MLLNSRMKHYKAGGLCFCSPTMFGDLETLLSRGGGSPATKEAGRGTHKAGTLLLSATSEQTASSKKLGFALPAADWPARARAAAPVEGRWPLVATAGVPQSHLPSSSCSLLPPDCSIQGGAETGNALLRKGSAQARKMKLLHCLCVSVSCVALFLFYTRDYSKNITVRSKG